MNKRLCHDWLDTYMSYTSNSEPPTLFRTWVGISVIAAALQRKCRLNWGMLTFYPNLYILLIGPSGTRKGTAMYPGQDLLRSIDIPMAADATTLQALIRRLKENNSSTFDPETGITELHSSMTIFSKEFTVFLGYKNDELIAALCDFYDCDNKWKYDTKGAGTDEINGLWVNLLGATTPDLVASSMPTDAIGGGLTSRIIFVVEEKKAKTVAMPVLSEKQEQEKVDLLVDLENIAMLMGSFKYSKEIESFWTTWYEKTDSMPPAIPDPKFSGYVQRRPNHVIKLAMILCVSRSNDMILQVQDFHRAIKLLEQTELKMPGVFSKMTGQNPIGSLIPNILSYLANVQEVSFNKMLADFYIDADEITLVRLLDSMDKMGYLQITYRGEQPTLIKFLGDPNEKAA